VQSRVKHLLFEWVYSNLPPSPLCSPPPLPSHPSPAPWFNFLYMHPPPCAFDRTFRLSKFFQRVLISFIIMAAQMEPNPVAHMFFLPLPFYLWLDLAHKQGHSISLRRLSHPPPHNSPPRFLFPYLDLSAPFYPHNVFSPPCFETSWHRKITQDVSPPPHSSHSVCALPNSRLRTRS